MTANASVVLFGGLAKERPYPGSTMVTSVNGAVATMIRTLAIELAPIRFNSIHPGIIGDSPTWMGKTDVIAAIRERTPGGRLAMTEDVVDAVDFLSTNQGLTASIYAWTAVGCSRSPIMRENGQPIMRNWDRR